MAAMVIGGLSFFVRQTQESGRDNSPILINRRWMEINKAVLKSLRTKNQIESKCLQDKQAIAIFASAMFVIKKIFSKNQNDRLLLAV